MYHLNSQTAHIHQLSIFVRHDRKYLVGVFKCTILCLTPQTVLGEDAVIEIVKGGFKLTERWERNAML